MWPFSKKDKYDEYLVSDAIPVSTLIRWYLYDLGVDDANAIAETFNLMPVSPEGEAKEKEDSLERMSSMMPLMAFIKIMSDINGKAIYGVQRNELKEQGVPLEQLEAEKDTMIEFYSNVSFAAVISAFSSATELGLIDINGTFTDLEALKGH